MIARWLIALSSWTLRDKGLKRKRGLRTHTHACIMSGSSAPSSPGNILPSKRMHACRWKSCRNVKIFLLFQLSFMNNWCTLQYIHIGLMSQNIWYRCALLCFISQPSWEEKKRGNWPQCICSSSGGLVIHSHLRRWVFGSGSVEQ